MSDAADLYRKRMDETLRSLSADMERSMWSAPLSGTPMTRSERWYYGARNWIWSVRHRIARWMDPWPCHCENCE